MLKIVDCKVEGMTCGNCALTISNYLKKKGAEDIIANPATGNVHFSLPENIKQEDILNGITQLGYPVVKDVNDTNQYTNRLKTYWIISIICWVPAMMHMFVSWHWLHVPWVQLFICIPVYIIGIIYFGKNALRSLVNKMPNMDVLVFISASAAFFYSIIGWYLFPHKAHDYMFFETCVSIITLVLTGNVLEEYTINKTAHSLKMLMQRSVTKAKIVLIDSIGKETIVETENKYVKVNDIVWLNTGDNIPADAIIISGNADIDESMISGESSLVSKSVNDIVIGGTVVVNGSLRCKTTATGEDTALGQIIKTVQQAQGAKPPLQKLADKISAVFVPIVILLAIITFIINYYVFHISFSSSMMRTIAVMVIACPCAMGLATPAAIMVGLGRAARMGILIKDGNTLQLLKDIKKVVFDKTGTLTDGQLVIKDYSTLLEDIEFKKVVYSLELHSTHPIAKSICKQWHENDKIEWLQVEEIKGIGIRATDKQNQIWEIGSRRILSESDTEQNGDLFLLKNKQLVGSIFLQDAIRNDAKEMIAQLHAMDLHTVMLSGDTHKKCMQVAEKLNIQEVHSAQLPLKKYEMIKAMNTKQKTAMVGDGINDAAALTEAHLGISLSDSTDIAKQSAQVVLLNNQVKLIPIALKLGMATYQTIKQNLFWAFFYNIIAMPVAACGLLTPTWGAALMAVSDIVLIINSLKLNYKKIK